MSSCRPTGTSLIGTEILRSARIVVKLTKKQTDDIGVPVDGPYKPEHYRY